LERGGATRSDRELVNFYVDGGFEYKGPFSRPTDACIGKAARQLDMDFAATGTFRLVSSTETVVELIS